jgi:hypothetical protein
MEYFGGQNICIQWLAGGLESAKYLNKRSSRKILVINELALECSANPILFCLWELGGLGLTCDFGAESTKK